MQHLKRFNHVDMKVVAHVKAVMLQTRGHEMSLLRVGLHADEDECAQAVADRRELGGSFRHETPLEDACDAHRLLESRRFAQVDHEDVLCCVATVAREEFISSSVGSHLLANLAVLLDSERLPITTWEGFVLQNELQRNFWSLAASQCIVVLVKYLQDRLHQQAILVQRLLAALALILSAHDIPREERAQPLDDIDQLAVDILEVVAQAMVEVVVAGIDLVERRGPVWLVPNVLAERSQVPGLSRVIEAARVQTGDGLRDGVRPTLPAVVIRQALDHSDVSLIKSLSIGGFPLERHQVGQGPRGCRRE